MDSFAKMRWGIICSVDYKDTISVFMDFGKWMVYQLEESATKLHLGHRFASSASFCLHAVPGSKDEVEKTYKQVREHYPDVSYVIHILPSKDSMEYQVLKDMTLAGALIGQGVLAENALSKFQCYQIDEVMANMNQWIGRRLAQITARRTQQTANEKVQSVLSAISIAQAQSVQVPKINRRKDNYRMTVSNNGGNKMSTFKRFSQSHDLPVTTAFTPRQQRPRPLLNQQMQNDYDYPVGVVLHSADFTNDGCYPHYLYRPPSIINKNITGVNVYNQQQSGNNKQKLQIKQPPHQQDASSIGVEGNERGKEVIISGYPINFNKFQIASLFSDFRPLSVQYIAVREAIVQFANKFHATQVIKLYNGRLYDDENFSLQVRTAAQEDLTKQIDVVQTKLARLLLKVTVENWQKE